MKMNMRLEERACGKRLTVPQSGQQVRDQRRWALQLKQANFRPGLPQTLMAQVGQT
jgi:hypothetical protein